MMTDTVDLMQLASAGQKLARVDDTDYLAVHVVLAWATDSTPTVYCAYHDWAATPIARLAVKEQEIAELAAGLERYATEATGQARRAESAEARVRELEAQLAERPPAETDIGPCPDCGKDGWKSAQSLQMHRQRVHQGMQAPPRKPIQQLDDDPAWRCAEMGCTGAFTRSLSDPAHCTQHASVHTNGHEIAA
jgi:hypothetical protein